MGRVPYQIHGRGIAAHKRMGDCCTHVSVGVLLSIHGWGVVAHVSTVFCCTFMGGHRGTHVEKVLFHMRWCGRL